jgi:transposase
MSATLFPAAGIPETPPEAVVGSGKTLRQGQRFVAVPGRDQLTFSARCTEDLVPVDAPVRVYDEILELLDFRLLEQKHPGGGRPAYPPQFLAKLLIFAYVEGIRSAREIARRLEYDLRFVWLAHELRPCHETLSNFRRDFRELLKDVFRQTVRLGMEAGLIELKHVALDGTKLAASARKTMKDVSDLDKALAEVEQEIERILAEADAVDAAEDAQFGDARGDERARELARQEERKQKLQAAQEALAENGQKRVSVTDPEALQQKVNDVCRPGYNGQLAVDDKAGFAVAQAVTTEQNDQQQFVPLAHEVEQNVGTLPAALPADSGYHSPETLAALEAEPRLKDCAYIREPKPTPADRFGHDDFQYDPATDTFTCPAGESLTFRRERTLQNNRCVKREYCAYGGVCQHCDLRAKCLSPKAKRRSLLIAPHEELAAAMRARVATEEGQAALQRRKETVEPRFGVLKSVQNLRQLLLRGLAGAEIEFGLSAIGLNVRILTAWALTGGAVGQLAQATS